jgi:hypothetical protein
VGGIFVVFVAKRNQSCDFTSAIAFINSLNGRCVTKGQTSGYLRLIIEAASIEDVHFVFSRLVLHNSYDMIVFGPTLLLSANYS